MEKSQHTAAYQRLTAALRKARESADLTQAEVAAAGPVASASSAAAPIGPSTNPSRPAAVPQSAVVTAATRERIVEAPTHFATAQPTATCASTGAAARAAHRRSRPSMDFAFA